MTNIEFVYFDLDDTLLDHKYAEKQALQEMVVAHSALFNHAAFEVVLKRYSGINHEIWHQYSLGKLSKDGAKVGRFTQLLEACQSPGIDQAAVLAQEYLDRYASHWVAIEGAIEAFVRTAYQLPVGILTNGFSEVQRSKLLQFPELGKHSKTIIISEDIGHLKPSPILFEHARAQAGLEPDRILYVGDSLSSDVEGGTAAGWKVAWYSDQDSDHPDVWSFTDWNDFSQRIFPGR